MNALALYRGVTTLLGPLVVLYLLRRRARGKEDAARLPERFGRADRPRPPGPLAWLHAASVGEATSALAVIERIRAERPGIAILVTTGTVTSARLLASRLRGERVFHQFVPVDRSTWVRRFLAHWRPDLAVWIESELWPALVAETAQRGIPMLLLNGRMSERSYRGWLRWPQLARTLVGAFTLCLAQDEIQAERLRRLGAARAYSVGDLKAAAAPLPADPGEIERLRRSLAGRPHWLAASTHPGEEAAAADAHERLAGAHPRLLTIVAPRHPKRGDEIAALFAARGLAVARWSRREVPAAETAFWLIDTLGELGLLYRLADIVFVGGSLNPVGGHNPLEPALLGCALLHGPDMSNCAGVAAELAAAGAAVEVADAAALAAAVGALIDDPAERARRAAAAASVAERHRHVLDAVMGELAPFLERIAPARNFAAA